MSNDYDNEEYNEDFVDEEDVVEVVKQASGAAARRSPSSSRSRTPSSSRSRRSSSASSHGSRNSRDSRDSCLDENSPKKATAQAPPAATRTASQIKSSHVSTSQAKTVSTAPEAASVNRDEYSDDEDFEYTPSQPPHRAPATTQQPQPPLSGFTRESSHVVRRGHAQQDPGSRGSETGVVEFIVGKAPKRIQSTVHRSGLSNAGSSHTSSVGLRAQRDHDTCDEEDISSSNGGSPRMSHVASFVGSSPLTSPPRQKSVSADRQQQSEPQQQPRVVATAPPPATRVASFKMQALSSDSENEAVNPSSSVLERKTQNKGAARPSIPSISESTPKSTSRQPVSAPAAPPPDAKAHLRKQTRDNVTVALKEPHAAKERRQKPTPPATSHSGGRISKELQRLIQLRDQLRHDVADMSIALEGFQGQREDRGRLRFFEMIESENQDLETAVRALKVGVTSQVNLSDRLAQLAREISSREKDLKDVQRELRKVNEETKHLARTAGGDDQTSVHDEFVKRKEELIIVQEGQRLRQQRQLEELALAYERVLQTTLSNEGKIIEVGYEVMDQHVSTMDQSEYQALILTNEGNRKKISRLKQAVAGIEYQYEPPAQIVEWQEKKAEDAYGAWESRAQQLLKQIKHRESTIMSNFGLLERPSHFTDPNDESSLPTVGAAIVPPPLPAPPKARPQISSTHLAETPAARKQTDDVTPQLSPRKPNPKGRPGSHRVDNATSAMAKEGNGPVTSARNAPPAKPVDVGAAAIRKNRTAPATKKVAPQRQPVQDPTTTPRLVSSPHLASPEFPDSDKGPREILDGGADSHEDRLERMEDEERRESPEAATPPGRSPPGGEVVDNDPADDYVADYETEDEALANAHHPQQSNATSSAYYDGGATTQPSFRSGPAVQQSQQQQHAAVQQPAVVEVEEEIPPWLMD
jgi:hypothetical protein